jgi:hypothetical protein
MIQKNTIKISFAIFTIFTVVQTISIILHFTIWFDKKLQEDYVHQNNSEQTYQKHYENVDSISEFYGITIVILTIACVMMALNWIVWCYCCQMIIREGELLPYDILLCSYYTSSFVIGALLMIMQIVRLVNYYYVDNNINLYVVCNLLQGVGSIFIAFTVCCLSKR